MNNELILSCFEDCINYRKRWEFAHKHVVNCSNADFREASYQPGIRCRNYCTKEMHTNGICEISKNSIKKSVSIIDRELDHILYVLNNKTIKQEE